jgi:hypothetical protein
MSGGRLPPGGAIVGGAIPVAGRTVTASASSSAISPSSASVTFRYAQAQGLMSGYGWVALAAASRMTSPTCDRAHDPITSDRPCVTETMWSTPDALCMSGAIPALPAAPVQADYDFNWGMEIGVNAADPKDAIGPAISPFRTIAFTFSGTPTSGIRAFVHRKGDPDATTYCLDSVRRDTAVALTKFNTKCWGDPTTVYLTPADLPNIDQIGLMIPSSSSQIIVNNFCLERISFQ